MPPAVRTRRHLAAALALALAAGLLTALASAPPASAADSAGPAAMTPPVAAPPLPVRVAAHLPGSAQQSAAPQTPQSAAPQTQRPAAPQAPRPTTPTPAPQPPAATATPTLTGTITGPGNCRTQGAPFRDVPATSPACNAVKWLAGVGVAPLTADSFNPAAPLRRGDLAVFLYRLANPGKYVPVCASRPYPDVAAADYTCGAIAWSKANHIVLEFGDGAFRPRSHVTRVRLVDALHRTAALATPPADPAASERCTAKPFADVPVSDRFCPAVSWARTAAILTDVVTGTAFRESATVTRAQFAQVTWAAVIRAKLAPGTSGAIVGPLSGATVLATESTTGRSYYTRANSRGRYAIAAAAGSYRVCVDASTVTSRSASGYADLCYGKTPWPWTNPLPPTAAPTVPVAKGAAARADIRLAAQPASYHRHRGKATPPPVRNSHYSLLYRLPNLTSRDGTKQSFAYYDPCLAVHYVIADSPEIPDFGVRMVHDAIKEISRASGLRFIYDGMSSEKPSLNRDLVQSRYGKRWVPILIGWTSAAKTDGLEDSIVGRGGSSYVWGAAGARAMGGSLVLDAPDLVEMYQRPSYFDPNGTYFADPYAQVKAIILHELGHVLGLGHVDDDTQLMYPMNTDGITGFGAGDLTGLYRLGNAACAPRPPVGPDTNW